MFVDYEIRPSLNIKQLCDMGEPIEIIDGDSLKFQLFTFEYLSSEKFKRDRFLVISILGP